MIISASCSNGHKRQESSTHAIFPGLATFRKFSYLPVKSHVLAELLLGDHSIVTQRLEGDRVVDFVMNRYGNYGEGGGVSNDKVM